MESSHTPLSQFPPIAHSLHNHSVFVKTRKQHWFIAIT